MKRDGKKKSVLCPTTSPEYCQGRVCLLILILFFASAVSAQTSSSNYNTSSSVVSGETNLDSTNYGMGAVIESFSEALTSSSYKNFVGFFYSVTFCGDGTCNSGETCSSCVADCGCSSGYTCTSGTCVADAVAATAETGGGGGSGGMGFTDEFSVDATTFNVKIVTGDLKTREFKIKNLENKTLSVGINLEGLENLILIDNGVSFEPFEEKTISFKIVSPDDIGVYPGKIVLTSSRTKKTIFITINTQSKDTLFDLSVNVLEEAIPKNKDLRAQMTLIPVGEKGVDVSMKYLIKDFKGKVYYENSETFYVDDQMSYVENFKVNNLDFEDYVLGVEMIYAGGFATASSQFKIIEEGFLPGTKLGNKTLIIIVAGVIIILIVAITFYRRETYKKYRKILNKRGENAKTKN